VGARRHHANRLMKLSAVSGGRGGGTRDAPRGGEALLISNAPQQLRELGVFVVGERGAQLDFVLGACALEPGKGGVAGVGEVQVVVADIRIIHTPVRAPRANALAERFIGTLRRECLDHLLVTGPRHLDVVLREYVQHFNAHRPHRSLHQHPPAGATPPRSGAAIQPLRRDRLGGLIHEYVQVA
jgi:hypothetical protein